LQILNCLYLYRCQGAKSGKDKFPTAKHPRTYTILDFCLKKRESYGKKPSIEKIAKTEKIPEKILQQQTKIVRLKKAAMIGRWVLGVN
jgi:hypothetical protein